LLFWKGLDEVGALNVEDPSELKKRKRNTVIAILVVMVAVFCTALGLFIVIGQ
jgi:flagellar basal body-associated protein FliL